MKENYGVQAIEIAKRFYLNPGHENSVEFTKGGPIRLKHRNMGVISGMIIGFETASENNQHYFHINLTEGENLTLLLNNYGFYSLEGSGDPLGVLLLSTATEREEIDFSTVRVQSTFAEREVFCILNQTHQEFMESLKDIGKQELAWLMDRQPVKSLFQLHDAIGFRFTMCNPSTGEFDAEMYCPGYKIAFNYRHLSDELNVILTNLTDQLHWSGF